MQQQWWVGWGEISVGNEENVAANAKESQRHHCLHPKRDEYESGRNIPQQICFAYIESSYAHVENPGETSVGPIVTEPGRESTPAASDFRPVARRLAICCACATSGHGAAAPLSSVMNVRRLIRSTRRRPTGCHD